MAAEIMEQKYRFMQPQKSSKYDSSNGIYSNYLHDLESILWVLVWTLLSYRKCTGRTNSESTNTSMWRAKTYSDLFSHGKHIEGKRAQLIQEEVYLRKRTKLTPEYFQPLKKLVISFRDSLHGAYINEENKFKLTKPILPSRIPIHKSIICAFQEVRIDRLLVSRIPLKELRYIESETASPSKRGILDGDMGESLAKKARYDLVLIKCFRWIVYLLLEQNITQIKERSQKGENKRVGHLQRSRQDQN